MPHEQPDPQPSLQSGERVVIVGNDAQNAVGGTPGTVVGHKPTESSCGAHPAVIIAIDQGPSTNAVGNPADLQRQDDSA